MLPLLKLLSDEQLYTNKDCIEVFGYNLSILDEELSTSTK